MNLPSEEANECENEDFLKKTIRKKTQDLKSKEQGECTPKDIDKIEIGAGMNDCFTGNIST